MKNIIHKVQTTWKALQMLSEPEVMNSIYAEINKKKERKAESTPGKLLFHKHFVVEVMS